MVWQWHRSASAEPGTVSTGDVVLLKMQSALACGILLANFDNGQPHSIVKFLDLQKTVADAVEYGGRHMTTKHMWLAALEYCVLSLIPSPLMCIGLCCRTMLATFLHEGPERPFCVR